MRGRTRRHFPSLWRHSQLKAFGDMGANAQLPLIQDRFVAGRENCTLCRHLNLADVGVASLADLAEGVTVGVAPPVVAGVASLAVAGVVSMADSPEVVFS